MLALHGGGATAEGAASFYNLELWADKNNFIIVYPSAANKAWSIPGMQAAKKQRYQRKRPSVYESFARYFDCSLQSRCSQRVLHRHFAGRMFAYYLAIAMNNRITAIAAVCDGISTTQAVHYVFKKPVFVLVINGTADSLNRRNEVNENADLLPTEE